MADAQPETKKTDAPTSKPEGFGKKLAMTLVGVPLLYAAASLFTQATPLGTVFPEDPSKNPFARHYPAREHNFRKLARSDIHKTPEGQYAITYFGDGVKPDRTYTCSEPRLLEETVNFVQSGAFKTLALSTAKPSLAERIATEQLLLDAIGGTDQHITRDEVKKAGVPLKPYNDYTISGK
jgi:hypothetical protein